MVDTNPEQLALALAQTARLVAGVQDSQWSAPTPCTEWTVRDLVGHLTAGNRLFAAALEGGAATPSPAGYGGDSGEGADVAFRESADALVRAFRRPGAMERLVQVPFGSVPGAVAFHLRLVETFTHAWDLALATGQRVDFPTEVVEQELRFTQGSLERVPPERRPFAPPQPVADDAPALDRLAACLGRTVDRAV